MSVPRSNRCVANEWRSVRRLTAFLMPAAVAASWKMLAGADGLSEGLEKRLHSRSVGVGQDEREGVVDAGLDGGVDIG